MDPNYPIFLRSAFDAYLERLQSQLEPDDKHLTYEFPYIASAKWTFMADMLISDELREVTNQLHQWRDLLRGWHAWNYVAESYEAKKAWTLRREFVEPLVHFCLIRPSSFRDLMTFVATNALHQLRLHPETTYKDRLEGDPTPSDPKPRPLTRRKKEDRLFRIASPITGSELFVAALRQLDDDNYRSQTKDYRNLNSHAIGPRLAIGITRAVTRHVVPATRMVSQPDGSGRIVEDPSRYVPSYSFGGLEPLAPEHARRANLAQYQVARTCFDHFTGLLATQCAGLPRADA